MAHDDPLHSDAFREDIEHSAQQWWRTIGLKDEPRLTFADHVAAGAESPAVS